MIILALALIAAAGFWVATWLVDTTLGSSRSFHHFSVVIAAGILIGVTLTDLLPEALEALGRTGSALAISGGFLALYLVETLTFGHTHHHEVHAHDPADGQAHGHSHAPATLDDGDGANVPIHAVVPFLIGLGIHNFADGVVIGASHEVSDAAATSVAIGILIHQLPVGLSFAAVLMASGMPRTQMRRTAALIASTIVVGALVVLAIPSMSATMVGALIGVAAGALLYIATGHLLPEAHSEERRPGLAAAFSIALLATIAFVSVLHDETPAHADDHSGDDAPAQVN
ncbi:MAG: ZIP family metal transporter [Gaiellales bacterium]